MDQRRYAIPRITAAALCVLLVVIAPVAASARSTADPVKLTMLWPIELKAAMDVVVANFQRVYPNITIEPQYLPNRQMETQLLVQLAAGNAPDVFKTHVGVRPTGIWVLAPAGRLLDLSGRKWQSRLYPGAAKYAKWQGKTYGWIQSVNPFGVLYNTELFSQLGLQVPKSFADLLALCRKIAPTGKIPIVDAFADAGTGTIMARSIMVNTVDAIDPAWADKRDKGQVRFETSRLWQRTMQQVVDMKDANCFGPSSAGMTLPTQFSILAKGDGVMSIAAGSYVPNIVAINPNWKYAMFPMPADDPKKALATAAVTNVISANASTKHPNEARLFIDFLAREKQSTLEAKVGGEIAPLDVKKGSLPPYINKYMGPLYKAGKSGNGNHIGWHNPDVWNTGIAAGLQGLITGQLTVDTLLKKADQIWDTPTG